MIGQEEEKSKRHQMVSLVSQWVMGDGHPPVIQRSDKAPISFFTQAYPF